MRKLICLALVLVASQVCPPAGSSDVARTEPEPPLSSRDTVTESLTLEYTHRERWGGPTWTHRLSCVYPPDWGRPVVQPASPHLIEERVLIQEMKALGLKEIQVGPNNLPAVLPPSLQSALRNAVTLAIMREPGIQPTTLFRWEGPWFGGFEHHIDGVYISAYVFLVTPTDFSLSIEPDEQGKETLLVSGCVGTAEFSASYARGKSVTYCLGELSHGLGSERTAVDPNECDHQHCEQTFDSPANWGTQESLRMTWRREREPQRHGQREGTGSINGLSLRSE